MWYAIFSEFYLKCLPGGQIWRMFGYFKEAYYKRHIRVAKSCYIFNLWYHIIVCTTPTLMKANLFLLNNHQYCLCLSDCWATSPKGGPKNNLLWDRLLWFWPSEGTYRRRWDLFRPWYHGDPVVWWNQKIPLYRWSRKEKSSEWRANCLCQRPSISQDVAAGVLQWLPKTLVL